VEDDNSSAQYDPDSGYLTVTLTKENKGEDFEDLDLLAKLLAPRRSTTGQSPSIEVLSSDDHSEDDLAAKAEALSLEHDEIAEGGYSLHARNYTIKALLPFFQRQKMIGNCFKKSLAQCLSSRLPVKRITVFWTCILVISSM